MAQLDLTYATPKAIDAWANALLSMKPSEKSDDRGIEKLDMEKSDMEKSDGGSDVGNGGKLIDLVFNASPAGRVELSKFTAAVSRAPLRACIVRVTPTLHRTAANRDYVEHAKTTLNALLQSTSLKVHTYTQPILTPSFDPILTSLIDRSIARPIKFI